MLLDGIEAYNRIAPEFARISERRKHYLDRVDRIVMDAIPPGQRRLLDVGAGTGVRAARIAQHCGLSDVTLLEPSAAMRLHWPKDRHAWPIRAEDLHCKDGEFDVILCLWNVLGHIFPAESRVTVLRQFRRLLSPAGTVFLDVNHRYNVRHYGVLATIPRLLRDHLFPDVRNGDVIARWDLGEAHCATKGHVFTHQEFCALVKTAGLVIEKRFVVDYGNGQVRRFSFEGNLLYVLRQRSE